MYLALIPATYIPFQWSVTTSMNHVSSSWHSCWFLLSALGLGFDAAKVSRAVRVVRERALVEVLSTLWY